MIDERDGGFDPRPDEPDIAPDSRPGVIEQPADNSWREGQAEIGDVVQDPVEYDPLPRSTDEPEVDDPGIGETPTLGGPLGE